MPEQIPVPEPQENKIEKILSAGEKPEDLNLETAIKRLDSGENELRNRIEQNPDMTPEARAGNLDFLKTARAQVECVIETITNKGLNLGFLSEITKNPGFYRGVGVGLASVGAYKAITNQLDLAFIELCAALLFVGKSAVLYEDAVEKDEEAKKASMF